MEVSTRIYSIWHKTWMNFIQDKKWLRNWRKWPFYLSHTSSTWRLHAPFASVLHKLIVFTIWIVENCNCHTRKLCNSVRLAIYRPNSAQKSGEEKRTATLHLIGNGMHMISVIWSRSSSCINNMVYKEIVPGTTTATKSERKRKRIRYSKCRKQTGSGMTCFHLSQQLSENYISFTLKNEIKTKRIRRAKNALSV